MDNSLYWIWYQLGVGVNSDVKAMLDFFDSPEGLYNASILEWAACSGFTATKIDRLASVTLDDAQRVADECDRNGWDIVTYGDSRYPEILKSIKRPPAVLYVDGDILCLKDRLSISIVGTRKASEYSLKAAKLLSEGIAQCGAVIVSGGALGVDSAAHIGAMSSGGRTVVVLGCGLGTDYLRANESLRREAISTGGAVVTEFPPHTTADRTTFPIRNRIISGLSRGIIVVEAAAKSGSLITAKEAEKQGRDVFAVPSPIFDNAFQGTNMLIENGAYVATSPMAVLGRYAGEYRTLNLDSVSTMYELSKSKYGANAPEPAQISFDSTPDTREKSVELQTKAASLVGTMKKIYDAIGDGLVTSEEIENTTGISSKLVFSQLTVLEIMGLVQKSDGDRFSRII